MGCGRVRFDNRSLTITAQNQGFRAARVSKRYTDITLVSCVRNNSRQPAPYPRTATQPIRPIKMEVVNWLFASRYAPEAIVLSLVLLAQAASVIIILRGPAAGAPEWLRSVIRTFAVLSFATLIFGSALRYVRVARYFPPWWVSWVRGAIIAWALFSVFLLGAFFASWALARSVALVRRNSVREHNPERRVFLRAAQTAIFAVPAAAIGYGAFIERFRFSVHEHDIPVPGLPQELDGLRVVQLTDIHLSPFLSERELAKIVAMANETRAHIGLVTGDLITARGDPLDACLNQLANLRADAGVFGCLGNHEIYARAENYTTARGAILGMRFLRHEAAVLRFGKAAINLAGVDYQRRAKRYLVGAEKLVQPGALNILLSHNPDVFPTAARQGYQVTISGHTHGGQIRVEILSEDLNIGRFFTPYVDGLYREGNSSVFVSRGIGTIGLPVRLGAPPEVSLLRLCRT
jgi:predicted MPP superfamily phosphohydrolase